MGVLSCFTANSAFASRSFDLDDTRSTHDFGSYQGTSPLNISGDSLSVGGGNVLDQRFFFVCFVFLRGLEHFLCLVQVAKQKRRIVSSPIKLNMVLIDGTGS